jgi:hypothetical protein
MAPLCSSNEGSSIRNCLIVGTRSVRRASGLLGNGILGNFAGLSARSLRVDFRHNGIASESPATLKEWIGDPATPNPLRDERKSSHFGSNTT